MKSKFINNIKVFLNLIRVKHYVKNFLIFFPLIFLKSLFTPSFYNVLFGFISFSFMASVVYIINDIKDVKRDRTHPIKKNRPIASGKISIKSALIIAIILYILSLLFSFLANNSMFVFILLMAYLLLNILYTFKLKDVTILDVLLLVVFYVIRIYYGAVIIDVTVSSYLYLTIMSAAFYLSLGKRRCELEYSSESRKVLKIYTREYLSRFMDISLTLFLVFYSFWAMSLNEKYIIISMMIVFVIFMKYSMIMEKSKSGDPTEILFKDKVLMLLVTLYTAYIIYLMK